MTTKIEIQLQERARESWTNVGKPKVFGPIVEDRNFYRRRGIGISGYLGEEILNDKLCSWATLARSLSPYAATLISNALLDAKSPIPSQITRLMGFLDAKGKNRRWAAYHITELPQRAIDEK